MSDVDCDSSVDVITIDKTGEFFRLVYDVKGRFAIHRITAEEAQVTLADFTAPGLLILIF